MGRVFTYWPAFAVLAVITTFATTFLVFRHVDLTFAQFAALLCAPLLQAVVVTWRITRPADSVASLGRFVVRQPLAQPVLLIDGVMLGAGVIIWDSHRFGAGSAVSVQATWTLAKAGAALLFCGAAVLRRHGSQRLALARLVVAPLLLLLALEPSTSWLAAAFARAHEAIGPNAEVFQRLAFYGSAFAVLVGLTLRSARAIRSRSREAGQLIELITAAAAALATTVALAIFNLPTVTQPFLGMATISASCASTAMLLAAIVLATARSGEDER
jgi:hypothetical protein